MAHRNVDSSAINTGKQHHLKTKRCFVILRWHTGVCDMYCISHVGKAMSHTKMADIGLHCVPSHLNQE